MQTKSYVEESEEEREKEAGAPLPAGLMRAFYLCLWTQKEATAGTSPAAGEDAGA